MKIIFDDDSHLECNELEIFDSLAIADNIYNIDLKSIKKIEG